MSQALHTNPIERVWVIPVTIEYLREVFYFPPSVEQLRERPSKIKAIGKQAGAFVNGLGSLPVY